ncbi:hypothetical protein [Salinarimonas ramus]|uniref:Peptidase inhibitor I78 family protein n=1 Tax=Salinarimonas ramus TaxID=690164 RepID=A0A917V629_9HYPH|nr:hypothetical protein [Salinarimonas ramus]GGK42027.1 hypothetical protein GCM10011322_31440 [Salinarimonas ramus]
MSCRNIFPALVLAAVIVPSNARADIDPPAVYHACDEAAVDVGFARAGLPSRIQASVVSQVAGRWQGTRMVVLNAPTNTGHVFCMTTLEMDVKLYKFDGREIIARD